MIEVLLVKYKNFYKKYKFNYKYIFNNLDINESEIALGEPPQALREQAEIIPELEARRFRKRY